MLALWHPGHSPVCDATIPRRVLHCPCFFLLQILASAHLTGRTSVTTHHPSHKGQETHILPHSLVRYGLCFQPKIFRQGIQQTKERIQGQISIYRSYHSSGNGHSERWSEWLRSHRKLQVARTTTQVSRSISHVLSIHLYVKEATGVKINKGNLN